MRQFATRIDLVAAARTVLTATVLTAVAGVSAPAAAQLSVDSLIRTLHPADSTTALDMEVRNDGDHAVDVRIELADWDITADGAHRFHPVGTLEGSCGDAVAVGAVAIGSAAIGSAAIGSAAIGSAVAADRAASTRLRLAAGEGVSVRVAYSGARGDVCRVMIWFRTDDVPLGDDDGVTFIMRTGVKLYVEPRRDGQ